MTENSLMFPPQALCTNSSSTEIIPADCYFIWNTIFSDKFPWPFLETRLPSPPLLSDQFSSVQFSYSVMSNSLRPHGLQHARPPCPSPNSWSPSKPMSIKLVMPSNHLILCCPLLLLLSIFPSIRSFSSESVLRMRWPKYWSFSFNISPSNEYSGLISFRMNWLYLLEV